MLRELPPTAGLPLQAGDLLPGGGTTADSLAEVLDLPTPIVASSGAAALWILLETLKAQRPGRGSVIVPAFTCPLVALAVAQAGLRLRLCDTRPGHFDLDLEQLRRHCDDDTLAVITTHLGGRVADAAGAAAIARSAGAYLVEDAAQALGARSAGRSVGLAGDAGFFSLGAGKGLSIYSGGLIVAADAGLHAAVAQQAAALAPARPLRETWRCLQLLGLALLYNPPGLVPAYGAPLRSALTADDVIGALSERFAPRILAHRVGGWRLGVARRAARRLGAFLDTGRHRAHGRRERLAAIPGVTVLGDAPGDEGTWPVLLVLLPDEARRDRALAALWRAGLGVSRAFACALPDYPELACVVPQADVPHARDFAARSLTVSNTHWMSERDFARILDAISGTLA
jgi:dTDP-4-amino-4,6-dideoxygalactose transaminase